MTVAPSNSSSDPNFPPNLSILPSSRPLRRQDPAKSAAHFDQDSGSEDAEQDIETYGIAGRTWEAAYLLCQYLASDETNSSATSVFDPPNPLALVDLDHSRQPRRRKILEVGSGTGFLGLSLLPHLLETDTLVLTDLENVCPLLTKNLSYARQRRRRRTQRHGTEKETTSTSMKQEAEEAEPTCLVRPLPWGESRFLDQLSQADLLPDYILASDLVYFPFLYPPLLKTLLGLTEYQSSDDPRRESDQQAGGGGGPILIFSYKIRSLVREQPFWEAFGRWFEFEAVQIGELAEAAEEEGRQEAEEALASEQEEQRWDKGERSWRRFGSSNRKAPETELDSDELFVFICRRRRSTLGVSDLLAQGVASDEDLMLGRNGLEGEVDGCARFEEMLLATLEWD